jgi:aspartyl-tRNA(Asn)/glutamyl-tRNA(Gln) amidotransferase subunit C
LDAQFGGALARAPSCSGHAEIGLGRSRAPAGGFLDRTDAHTMSLTLEDVQRIASLARLALDEEQAVQVLSQLQGIFGLIEELQAVDTTGVEPMSYAQDVVQRLRADEVTEADQRELFQRLAPQAEAGLYLVPKVIE